MWMDRHEPVTKALAGHTGQGGTKKTRPRSHKKAHATPIQVPKRRTLQPDRELLAVRFDAFGAAA